MDLLKPDSDFTDLFNQTVEWNKVANGGEFDFSNQRKELQQKCLMEEVLELEEAIDNNDPVEAVDAICDILFVGFYAWVMCSNREPDVYDISHGIRLAFSDYSLEDFLWHLKIAVEKKDYFEVVKLILEAGIAFNFDLKGAYANVVESNFSKFPEMDSVVLHRELERFKNNARYSNVVAAVVHGRFVFRADYGEGKVVKPSCFIEPNLKQFIRE